MCLVEKLKIENVKIVENFKHVQISSYWKFFLMRPAGQVQSVIPTVLFLMYGDNVESMYSGFLHEFDATLLVLGESSLMHWKRWKTRINCAANMHMNSQGPS